MLPYLIFLLLGPEKEIVPPVDAAQARLDSLTVYMTYRESIEILKNTTDPYKWYAYEDSISRVAACALLRLSKYNHGTYEPIMEFNREGYGVAFSYPQPGEGWLADFRAKRLAYEGKLAEAAKVKQQAALAAAQPKEPLQIVFTVVEKQTHFLVSANGKTKMPYVEMHHYAKGRVLVKTEKVDPISLKPIALAEPENKSTALAIRTE